MMRLLTVLGFTICFKRSSILKSWWEGVSWGFNFLEGVPCKIVMLTLDWVSPKWGSMMESIGCWEWDVLIFSLYFYSILKQRVHINLVYVGVFCQNGVSKHSPYDMYVSVEFSLNANMSFHVWYLPHCSCESNVGW